MSSKKRRSRNPARITPEATLRAHGAGPAGTRPHVSPVPPHGTTRPIGLRGRPAPQAETQGISIPYSLILDARCQGEECGFRLIITPIMPCPDTAGWTWFISAVTPEDYPPEALEDIKAVIRQLAESLTEKDRTCAQDAPRCCHPGTAPAARQRNSPGRFHPGTHQAHPGISPHHAGRTDEISPERQWVKHPAGAGRL